MNTRTKFTGLITILGIFILLLVSNPVWAEENIKVDEHLVLFNSHLNELQVKELYQITNTSTEKVKKSLIITLPTGAQNVVVNQKKLLGNDSQIINLDQNQYEIQGERIVLKAPLDPGKSKVFLIYYNLDFPENLKEVVMPVPYFTDTVYVLTPDDSLTINSKDLHSMGIQSLDEIQYQVMAAHELSPDSIVSFQILPDTEEIKKGVRKVSRGFSASTGFHSASHLNTWNNSPLKNTNPHLWLLFVLSLVIGILVLLTLYLREKHKQKKYRVNREGIYTNLLNKQNRLLKRIKDLDQQMEAGKIEEDVYQVLRQQYKEILIKVKLRLKKLEEGF